MEAGAGYLDTHRSPSVKSPWNVIVVDDQVAEHALFENAFGEVTLCRSITDLEAALSAARKAGRNFDLAFVDFALTGRANFSLSRDDGHPRETVDSRTGLSALIGLRQHTGARIVSYSQGGESGRMLFFAAAHRWFAADAALSKDTLERETLRRFAEALLTHRIDPTDRRLAWLLRSSSHLIDALLPEYRWITAWRAWTELNGDPTAIRIKYPTLPGNFVTHTFRERASEAASRFDLAFYGRVAEDEHRSNVNRKGLLTRFAGDHRSFLFAPDLHQALRWRDDQALASSSQ